MEHRTAFDVIPAIGNVRSAQYLEKVLEIRIYRFDYIKCNSVFHNIYILPQKVRNALICRKNSSIVFGIVGHPLERGFHLTAQGTCEIVMRYIMFMGSQDHHVALERLLNCHPVRQIALGYHVMFLSQAVRHIPAFKRLVYELDINVEIVIVLDPRKIIYVVEVRFSQYSHIQIVEAYSFPLHAPC